MNEQEQLRQMLKQFIKDKDVSPSWFATDAKIDYKRFSSFHSNEHDLTNEEKEKLLERINYWSTHEMDPKNTRTYISGDIMKGCHYLSLILCLISIVYLLCVYFTSDKLVILPDGFFTLSFALAMIPFCLILLEIILKLTKIRAKHFNPLIEILAACVCIFTYFYTPNAKIDNNNEYINTINEALELSLPTDIEVRNCVNIRFRTLEMTFDDTQEKDFLNQIEKDDRFLKNIRFNKIRFKIPSIINNYVIDLSSFKDVTYDYCGIFSVEPPSDEDDLNHNIIILYTTIDKTMIIFQNLGYDYEFLYQEN